MLKFELKLNYALCYAFNYTIFFSCNKLKIFFGVFFGSKYFFQCRYDPTWAGNHTGKHFTNEFRIAFHLKPFPVSDKPNRSAEKWLIMSHMILNFMQTDFRSRLFVHSFWLPLIQKRAESRNWKTFRRTTFNFSAVTMTDYKKRDISVVVYECVSRLELQNKDRETAEMMLDITDGMRDQDFWTETNIYQPLNHTGNRKKKTKKKTVLIWLFKWNRLNGNGDVKCLIKIVRHVFGV